jgi:broad specificity phosphatase PhoE
MTTRVHVVRHGEVHNPDVILYGRLPGYGLSPLGLAMAERIASVMAGRDIVVLASSPLQRARESIAPVAAALGLDPAIDERLIEAGNVFEGKRFGVGDGALRVPSAWWQLRNPFRPSWGEPYDIIAARMLAAIEDAARAARGHEALLVSHQLPIWTARCAAEGRRLWHDPGRRQCSLSSVTTFVFDGDGVEPVSVEYTEPALDLLPARPSRRLQVGS